MILAPSLKVTAVLKVPLEASKNGCRPFTLKVTAVDAHSQCLKQAETFFSKQTAVNGDDTRAEGLSVISGLAEL